ncbi:hypothetical protein B0J12DRAFT_695329 [Macrophomina phaseolina]|uniref:DUF6594 domain-containing protein n=1 Tax=Macrophomina phaseolina TaxID=35725 RepID=A0ABQ8GNT6_9PEZI|nr:hypothetical protein B0J12DRAFT_695329 [Macrophomina phaseolina]
MEARTKIMDKLKEYNDAIIQQDSMLRMKAPSQRDLHDVQKYLESSHMGPSALFGSDAEVWGSVERPHSHAKDLITLLGRHEYDSFSQWVTERASRGFLRVGWPQAKSSWKEPHL